MALRYLALIFFINNALLFADANNEIKIGALLPLSGAMHSLGDGSKKGLELAVQDINSKGGVAGKNLKIVYEDSLSEPTKAIAAFNALIENIDLPIVASELTSVIQAVKPIADKQGVLLAIGATLPDILKDSKFGIRNMVTSDTMVTGTIQLIKNKRFKNISVLVAAEEWGVGALGIIKTASKEIGFKIGAIESIAKDEVDLKSTLLRLKAKNPEPDLTVILLVGSVQSSAIKQIYQSKMSGSFLSWYVCTQPEVLNDLAPYYQNQYSIEGYRPENLDGFKSFIKLYEEKYQSKYPEFNALTWYDSIHFLAEALNAGNKSAPAIKEYITNKSKFEGILGTTIYNKIGDSVHQTQVEVIQGKGCNKYIF